MNLHEKQIYPSSFKEQIIEFLKKLGFRQPPAEISADGFFIFMYLTEVLVITVFYVFELFAVIKQNLIFYIRPHDIYYMSDMGLAGGKGVMKLSIEVCLSKTKRNILVVAWRPWSRN
jgi:hypothetical protein